MNRIFKLLLFSYILSVSSVHAAPETPSAAGTPDLGSAIALTDAQYREYAVGARDSERVLLKTGGLAVDTANRFAVISFYRNTYMASEGWEGRMGWSGNLGACNAGTVSSAFHDDTGRRINYFRAMAGLPADIAFNAAKNADSQQAAQMMSRNNALSHAPPSSWLCWTVAGSNAASHANIALGSTGPAAIDLFMEDPGANNVAAGHRRWILYSMAGAMGNGGVPDSGASYRAAAALWVIGDFSPTPAAVPYIAWPPKGYVPYTLVFPRWSFGIPGAPLSAFNNATVTMTMNGAPMAVQIVHPTASSPAAGYGDPTIVWQPVGLPAGAPSQDVVYVVTIGNIAGVSPATYTYTVRAIDPNDSSDAYEFDGSAAAAKDISNGQIQNHTMHVAGDVDWVKFTVGGAGASNVRVETSGASGDTHMWLFGPNDSSTLVAYDDESGTGSFSLITKATLAPGTYYLGIRENGDNATIAAYTVQASWTTAAGPTPDAYEFDGHATTAKDISNGQTQNHTMHVAGDVDWVKFTVGAAGASNVRVETSGASGDTHMWLFGPNNSSTLVAYDNDNGTGSFSLIQVATLAAGTYYLGIREYGDNATIAAYTVNVSWTTAAGPAPDAYEFDGHATTAKDISNGQTQNHSMHVAGDVDWVKFTVGAAGASNVRVETGGASGDTHMWLFGPNSSANLIAYADEGGIGNFSLIQVPTLAAGTYYLGIREYGDNATIAAYTVKVNWLAGPGGLDAYEFDGTRAAAKTILNNEIQTHSIYPADDVDWVKIQKPINETRTLRVETGGTTGDTKVWLYGPTGMLIAYNDDRSIGNYFSLINASLWGAGTYYIGVREWSAFSTIPAYTLKASWVTP